MNDFYSQNIITIWITVFAFEVAMGLLAQVIAERKGHSKRWFWAGFFLSLVGLVWAAGLPDEHVRRQLKQMREAAPVREGGTLMDAVGTEAGDGGEGELVAVLAAAVAAMGEREGKRFLLKSFRPAGESSTAWNRTGRAAHASNARRQGR